MLLYDLYHINDIAEIVIGAIGYGSKWTLTSSLAFTASAFAGTYANALAKEKVLSMAELCPSRICT